MKPLSVIFLILLIGTCFISCKAKQVTADSTKLVAEQEKTDEVTDSLVIQIPFSDTNYQTNNNFFRAVSSGTSPEKSTAKKIALINAKALLAGNIQTIVNITTENYTHERIFENNTEFVTKFTELSSQLFKQILVNVVTIGEESIKNDDGKFTFWIAIEMNKNEVLSNLNNQISKENQLQKEYDKYQYENIFNQEMDKLISTK